LTATPRISVCVPLFNKAATVERCLGTVLAARDGEMEVVVFDNGSNDGSSEIVERMAAKDPRVRYFRLDHTIMIQESWRMAFLHSRGELLKLHSGDDEMHPEFWSHMLPPLENPEIDYAMCIEKVVATAHPGIDVVCVQNCFDAINNGCRRLLALRDPAQRARQIAVTCSRMNNLGNIYKVVVRRSCLPLERWRALTPPYPMPTSYPDWDYLVRLVLNHRGHFVEKALSTYAITPDAPLVQIEKDRALFLADSHLLMLMVVTVLADPTLHRLRSAMTPDELQGLYEEAVRRLTHTTNLALAMPASISCP
jgi:glycosyltransferase involved in cell wall biosynthesis